ncbi:protein DOG1-like 4 [Cicer arietinum]|uniref:Protein DOG1-like 4 n=1 Tax=Cicer arietinum TaxID=3827 RepID=A0A1S2XAG2_CICAR|nr:protein DOG1-like 4 [Cicer arietinum]
MKNTVVEKFSEFYQKWIFKLEEILHQLLQVSKTEEQEIQSLVSKVTTHLKEYYTVKWGAAHEDVVIFFTPTWLSPLENAHLWVTGWKPSTVFRILDGLNAAFDMTEEQKKKIDELRVRVRIEEEKVEREMERQQVAMADLKMVELAKLSCRARKGDARVDGLVGVALKAVFGGLEKVMKTSDCVRLKTLKGVLDVLTPIQCVEFLAANIGIQLRLRKFGMKRDLAAGCILNEEI